MHMSQDWESMKQELQDVFGNHRAGYEPFKNDLWLKHKGTIERDLADFLALPEPKNSSELQKRTEHKDRLIREWERTILIADAEIGTRGQGGVVRSLFTLHDSIEALDAGSTKLTKQMLRLTVWITVMTFVLVVMTGVMVWDIILTHWISNKTPPPVVAPEIPATKEPHYDGK
jgi:hypothetical protein